jgi:hypothetical protein
MKLSVQHCNTAIQAQLPQHIQAANDSKDNLKFNTIEEVLEHYKDCFADSEQDIGRIPNIYHKIRLTTDKSIARPPYRCSVSQRN